MEKFTFKTQQSTLVSHLIASNILEVQNSRTIPDFDKIILNKILLCESGPVTYSVKCKWLRKCSLTKKFLFLVLLAIMSVITVSSTDSDLTIFVSGQSLIKQHRLSWNSTSSCLRLLSAPGITACTTMCSSKLV